MSARGSFRLFRRALHNTPAARAEKLPFEKPLFESETLSKMQREEASLKRMEFFGNMAVILVGVSAIARIGYYMVHGKPHGATALPPRTGKANSDS